MANPIKTTFLCSAMLLLLSGCHSHSNHSKQTKQLVNQSLADMQLIKGGSYLMGPSNPDWQAGNDATPHKVTLSSFYISKYNVSFRKYDQYSYAINTPLIERQVYGPFKGVSKKNNKFLEALRESHPVDAATWYQAHTYCHWLAKKTGLSYSLPTEAQWEYVARARAPARLALCH